jgi:hypothetical protein
LQALVALGREQQRRRRAADTDCSEGDAAEEGRGERTEEGEGERCSAWWRRLRRLVYAGKVTQEDILPALGSLQANLIDRNIAFDVAANISASPP